jgi:hypothetical protein
LPLLWQFVFDGCSFSPFESLLSTSFGSIARSPNQIQTTGKPSSSLVQSGNGSSPSFNHDCLFSPSIIPANYSTNYSLRSLELPTNDCSHSPSTISQFQTKALVEPHLHSTATTEAIVDLPLRLTAPALSVAGPPRRPTTATVADHSTATEASVDLPLRSKATVADRSTATLLPT